MPRQRRSDALQSPRPVPYEPKPKGDQRVRTKWMRREMSISSAIMTSGIRHPMLWNIPRAFDVRERTGSRIGVSNA